MAGAALVKLTKIFGTTLIAMKRAKPIPTTTKITPKYGFIDFIIKESLTKRPQNNNIQQKQFPPDNRHGLRINTYFSAILIYNYKIIFIVNLQDIFTKLNNDPRILHYVLILNRLLDKKILIDKDILGKLLKKQI